MGPHRRIGENDMTHDPFGVCLEPECHDSSEKELPSVADMARGFLDSAKDVIMGVVQNEGVIVTDEIYNTRMSICNACDFLRKEDKRCTQCGCYMEAKSKFKKTYCPVGKWNHE
jgi:hypothetical protein